VDFMVGVGSNKGGELPSFRRNRANHNIDSGVVLPSIPAAGLGRYVSSYQAAYAKNGYNPSHYKPRPPPVQKPLLPVPPRREKFVDLTPAMNLHNGQGMEYDYNGHRIRNNKNVKNNLLPPLPGQKKNADFLKVEKVNKVRHVALDNLPPIYPERRRGYYHPDPCPAEQVAGLRTPKYNPGMQGYGETPEYIKKLRKKREEARRFEKQAIDNERKRREEALRIDQEAKFKERKRQNEGYRHEQEAIIKERKKREDVRRLEQEAINNERKRLEEVRKNDMEQNVGRFKVFSKAAVKLNIPPAHIEKVTNFILMFEASPMRCKNAPNIRRWSFKDQHISRKEALEANRIPIPYSMTKTQDGEWIVHLKSRKAGGRLLGDGSFKKVKVSMYISTGELVANATSVVSQDKSSDVDFVLREAEIAGVFVGKRGLAGVRSAVQYRQKDKGPFSHPAPKISMITTLYNRGDLSKSLNKLSVLDITKVCADVISGLLTLHQHDVFHRDIKCLNILLNYSPNEGLKAAITDFGIALRKTDGAKYMIGTPLYMSPEMLHDSFLSKSHDIKVKSDIFAFGLVVLELLGIKWPGVINPSARNVPPMIALRPKSMLTNRQSAEYNQYRQQLSRILSLEIQDSKKSGLRNLAVSCILASPKKRPTAFELQERFEEVV
jgi:hypothetical protein